MRLKSRAKDVDAHVRAALAVIERARARGPRVMVTEILNDLYAREIN